jgi:N-acetylneuraminic acid mutarotase
LWFSLTNKKAVLSALFVVVLVLLATVSMQPAKAAGDFWVEKAPMPTASAYAGAVTVKGEIYVIIPNYTYLYDPSTDTWSSKSSMPTVQYGFASATYQDMIYVFGGCSGFNATSGYPINCTQANEVFNPATDRWENRAPMPSARAELQANVVNGKIYLIGGTLPNGDISNASEVYDPSSDSWSAAAPIPYPVGLYASAVVNNKIFVEGGGQSGPKISDLNQIYDTETNLWALGEPLPAPLVWAAAASTSGVVAPARLFVLGGTSDGINGVNTTNRIYDPQSNSWTIGALMPTTRGALSVAVVNNTLYALGGTDNFPNPQAGTTATNEQYFPSGYGEHLPPSPTLSATYIAVIIAVVVIIVVAVAFVIRKHGSKD